MADQPEPCPVNQFCVRGSGHEGDCSPFTAQTIAAFGRLAAVTAEAGRRVGAAWAQFARDVLKARERTQKDYVLHPPTKEDPDVRSH